MLQRWPIVVSPWLCTFLKYFIDMAEGWQQKLGFAGETIADWRRRGSHVDQEPGQHQSPHDDSGQALSSLRVFSGISS